MAVARWHLIQGHEGCAYAVEHGCVAVIVDLPRGYRDGRGTVHVLAQPDRKRRRHGAVRVRASRGETAEGRAGGRHRLLRASRRYGRRSPGTRAECFRRDHCVIEFDFD